MTAIAGFWDLHWGKGSEARCRASLEALQPYGPDGTELTSLGSFSLGRNLFRLPPFRDDQPVIIHAGRHAFVGDLRLDGRDELGTALGLSAGETAALPDARLVLAALERWGEAALDRIIGDFAFAWFDGEARRLTLVRDRLGQRPLFYHCTGDFVAFASMPKGIHATGLVVRRPDPETLARYLAQLPQAGSGSFFDQIERVQPGHVVTIEQGVRRERRYWSPLRGNLRLRSFDDYVEAYRAELDRAVASRLAGLDGAVATHLSAGWDSGAVTATAARIMADRGGRVIAFTAVPVGGRPEWAPRSRFGDEGPLAATTAELYDNVEHVLVGKPAQSPVRHLDRYSRSFERPVYNAENHVWLASIRDQARARGVPVLLTGEIGNWTISASPSSLLADYLRQGRLLDWSREAWAMYRQRRARLRGVLANSFRPWIPDQAWRRLGSLSSAAEPDLLSALHPRLRAALVKEKRRASSVRERQDYFSGAAEAISSFDLGEYRKGILGGWGVDKRDATADSRLIEFCLSLPLEMLLSGGKRRPLARAALADRLPAAVLDAPGKGYQALNWGADLTRDLPAIKAMIDVIAADDLACQLVDVDLLRQLVRDWPKDGWGNPQVMARYRIALVSGLTAGNFAVAAGQH